MADFFLPLLFTIVAVFKVAIFLSIIVERVLDEFERRIKR